MKTDKTYLTLLFVVIGVCTLIAFTPIPGKAAPLFQSTVTPGAPAYCPATATNTSVVPTFFIPTFGGFPTSSLPTQTHTPCPPGGPCPSVTPPPTYTPSVTPSPTITPTATNPPFMLQMTAITLSGTHRTDNIHTTVQVGENFNDAWVWISTTNNAYDSVPTIQIFVKSITGGNVTGYWNGEITGSSSGVINAQINSNGYTPVPKTGFGSKTIPTTSTSLVYAQETLDTNAFTHAYTITIKLHVSALDVGGVNTPTPVVTPTITPVPSITPQGPCVPGGELVFGGNPIINGDLNPVLKSYECYQIIPAANVSLPSPDWAPFDMPESIGVPGVKICISFYGMSLSVFGLDVMSFLGVILALMGAGIIYHEIRT